MKKMKRSLSRRPLSHGKWRLRPSRKSFTLTYPSYGVEVLLLSSLGLGSVWSSSSMVEASGSTEYIIRVFTKKKFFFKLREFSYDISHID